MTTYRAHPARIASLLVAMIVRMAYASGAQAPEAAQIAGALADGSAQERTAAIAAIRKIPVAERDPQIAFALTRELDRLHQQLEQRELALASGQPLPPSEEQSEYLFSVLDVAAQHADDSTMIRPLLPFIGTGNRVVDTLAGFGELAFPDVIGVARYGLSSQTDVHSALFTLQRMLERPGKRPLSAASKRLIVEVARERLSGAQKETVVMTAIDLAVATGDPQLIERVQTLGQNSQALKSLGIGDDIVGSIQKRAQAALARRPR